jgi:hypothetical protein
MLQDGVYSTQLGDLTPLADDIWESAQLWLGIKVDADDEMTPRVRIVAVPYAMRAKVAETVVDAGGAQGPQGKQGPAGAQGPQGKQGATGADGAFVAQGPAGPDGAQGPQGKSGDPGAGGAEGAQGAQGPQGKSGPEGAAGADGATGAQGPQGKAGADGAGGAAGAQGPQGKAGADGATGAGGAAGTDGAAGRGTVVFGRMLLNTHPNIFASLSTPPIGDGYFSDGWTPEVASGGSVMPRDGEILNLFLRPCQNSHPGVTPPHFAVLTVHINGAPTDLWVLHEPIAGIDPVSNTSTVVAVQQGDIVNLRLQGGSVDVMFYSWSLEIR